MAAVTLGLGARSLRDTDYFSKSDPFVVVSRPNLSGGFEIIRQSETKNNTLNPDWKDFYFTVDEICNGDTTLNIKFEVYDDDGKIGLDSKDKLIGQGFFSLKHLESAYNVQSNLPIQDGKNKGKNKGALVVRTFKYHNSPTVVQNNSVGIGHVPSSAMNQTGGYPGSGGQPGRPGYPSPVAGYPGGAGVTGGYPSAGPPNGGYPLGQAMNMGPGMPSYPPQQQPPVGGYPSAAPLTVGGGYGGAPGAPGGAFGGAPGGGYGGAPGYPGAPGGGYSGAPSYPSGPGAPGGGFGGPAGYPNAPGGGNPGYPGGQNIGGGGLFPDSHLPPGPGYR